ncbi:Suppressor of actin 1 [Giardia muris]|uniref:Suppressor of actin 1 n=1 Tax=Giardia muris TaxID=5742 RepID=A0A4Z1T4E2_GIAMU|nr:Suppressor of actin 1 [Giardia muris]|eukprot:TNJ28863.1 Suppressor of actin 1 [Giardia muris]
MILRESGKEVILQGTDGYLTLSYATGELEYGVEPPKGLEELPILLHMAHFLGVITAFGMTFILVGVAQPSGTSVRGRHCLYSHEQPGRIDGYSHPIPIQRIHLLHANNCHHYISTLVRKAIQEACQDTYVDLFRRYDPDDTYCWNRHLLPNRVKSVLPMARVQQGLTDMLVYCFSGFYEVITAGLSFQVRLQRWIDNCGQRYFSRGIDPHGFTANTARVQFLVNGVVIYTLFRGSLPLTFEQPCATRYTPPIKIAAMEMTTEDRSRFETLLIQHADLLLDTPTALDQYSLICVNALHSKGAIEALDEGENGRRRDDEERLSRTFQTLLNGTKLPITCSHIDVHRISRDEVKMRVDELVRKTFTYPNEQTQFLRVNCLDCADRTTLLQTYILQGVLQLYFQRACPDLCRTCRTCLTISMQELRYASFRAGETCSYGYLYAPPHGRLLNTLPRLTPITKAIDKAYDGFNSLYRYIVNRYRQPLSKYNLSFFQGEQNVPFNYKGTVLYLPVVISLLLLILITSDAYRDFIPYAPQVVYISSSLLLLLWGLLGSGLLLS